MESILQCLISLTVKKIERVHDYLQILFSDGTAINVYSNYRYDRAVHDLSPSIHGEKVVTVSENQDGVTIVFSGGGHLLVGLKDEDYNGPEAIELIRKGKETVIWN